MRVCVKRRVRTAMCTIGRSRRAVLVLLVLVLVLVLLVLLVLVLLVLVLLLLLLARAGGVEAAATARRVLYGCRRNAPLPLLRVAPPAQLAVELPILDLAAAVHVDLIEESICLLARHVPQSEQGQPLAELLLGDGARAVAVPLPEDL